MCLSISCEEAEELESGNLEEALDSSLPLLFPTSMQPFQRRFSQPP